MLLDRIVAVVERARGTVQSQAEKNEAEEQEQCFEDGKYLNFLYTRFSFLPQSL
jgi:hypothetical protein